MNLVPKIWLLKIKFIMLWCSCAIFVAACNWQPDMRKDLTVRGVIMDSLTNRPIPNAKVTILGYYRVWEEESSRDIDTITDKDGRFTAHVSKAFKINVGAIAEGYHPSIIGIDEFR